MDCLQYIGLSLSILAMQQNEAGIGVQRDTRAVSPALKLQTYESQCSVQPNGHHDEETVIPLWHPNDAWVQRIAHLQHQFVATTVSVDVEEVLHVDARLVGLTLQLCAYFFPCISKIDVLGREHQLVRFKTEPH